MESLKTQTKTKTLNGKAGQLARRKNKDSHDLAKRTKRITDIACSSIEADHIFWNLILHRCLIYVYWVTIGGLILTAKVL